MTEQKFRQSEERQKRAEAIAHLGSWEMDIASGEEVWSDEFYRICGLIPGSIRPSIPASLALTHPDDREMAGRILEQFLSSGGSYVFEKRIRRPDGEVRWVLCQGEMIVDNNDHPWRAIGSLLDITERKRMEIALRDSEALYRHLAEDMPEMICQFLMDSTLTYANRAYREFYQIGLPEIIGKRFLDFSMPGEEGREVMEQYRYLTPENPRVSYVHTAIGPDGSRRYQHWTDQAMFDENGQAASFQAIGFDITEHKQAEEALYREKELFRVTLQSIGDGVITVDQENRVAMLNTVAENLSGWSQEDAQGRPLDEVFHVIDEETGQPCDALDELTHSCRLTSADGTVRPVEGSAAEIRDQNQEVVGAILVFRDVTEKRVKEADILFLSYHDWLTGLYNRSFFEQELKRLDMERQLPISLIIGDVNGLKLINDVYGHLEGDRLLKSIAAILKNTCRGEDIIARWGGDEFIILLPQTPLKKAEEICQRISQACTQATQENWLLSISLGCAAKMTTGENLEETLKKAEIAMYRRKLLDSKSFRNQMFLTIKKAFLQKSQQAGIQSENISRLVKIAGTAFGCNQEEMATLTLLATLHDIGEVVVSDGILNKKEKLSREEWQEIKRHSEIGYQIARSSPEMSQLGEYILCHHEHWDGSGYPRGLRGENIPRFARIFAVIDAYDAMTSERPYRHHLSELAARQELCKASGSQFDPQVVEVFLTAITDLPGIK